VKHQETGKADAQALDFDQFTALTFDCYGTLIDWESGLLGALRPLLRSHGQNLVDGQIPDIYSELEPKVQNRRYRQVLADVYLSGFVFPRRAPGVEWMRFPIRVL
jgi:hypothetical protein